MPWPKGKPRKGHVNADGTPHAKWGSKVNEPVVRKPRVTKTVRIRKVSAEVFDGGVDVNHPEVGREYSTDVTFNQGGRPNRSITERCPNPKCQYSYADGGYCPKCGWTAPVKIDPYGTNTGPTRGKKR